MAQVTFQGTPVNTAGELPAVGQAAPDFTLTKTDMSDASLADYKGKKLVLNIFPSIDTPVCATSVRRFNDEAGKLENTEVLCISRDLPFALARFCGAEGLESVISASELRSDAFGKDYGVRIIDSALAGLFARAIVVIDEEGKVIYTQLVSEIAEEPDYQKALASLS
ncbi:thiol peroxidase [Desulfobulbus sp. N2]|nr:thiol peroxidase [Desulfobulbus sp. N2]MCW5210231.1 thiol peroxidase [Desulfobulbus sp. N3]WLE95483.1 MAG: thiol peroxidase [Candidatus Electrothrix communis]